MQIHLLITKELCCITVSGKFGVGLQMILSGVSGFIKMSGDVQPQPS